MDPLGWNTVLFIGKWVFVGLIYFVLSMILLAVRRELALRVEGQPAQSPASPGKLRVLRTGADLAYQPGMLLDLHPTTNLGKDLDNDIVLQDNYVSRHHARLHWDGAGWWLEDLGSKNGTFVNNKPCLPHVPQAVSIGANLGVGGMLFEMME